MTLREWREWKGLSLRAAAPLFGFSSARLSALEHAEDLMLSTMDMVKRVTKGKVTRLDWPEREEP